MTTVSPPFSTNSWNAGTKKATVKAAFLLFDVNLNQRE
jgi:hypothetical protein